MKFDEKEWEKVRKLPGLLRYRKNKKEEESDRKFDEFLKSLKDYKSDEKLSDEFKEKLAKRMEEEWNKK